jgi:hypothetical protein
VIQRVALPDDDWTSPRLLVVDAFRDSPTKSRPVSSGILVIKHRAKIVQSSTCQFNVLSVTSGEALEIPPTRIRMPNHYKTHTLTGQEIQRLCWSQ